jgi:hypothetical protein
LGSEGKPGHCPCTSDEKVRMLQMDVKHYIAKPRTTQRAIHTAYSLSHSHCRVRDWNGICLTSAERGFGFAPGVMRTLICYKR